MLDTPTNRALDAKKDAAGGSDLAPTDFERLTERALSRRRLMGGATIGAAAFVVATTTLSPLQARAANRLGFDAVPANTLDTVTLPEGYSWQVLIRWGDPLWSHGPHFDQVTRGDGASQELAFGDNTDGMALFTDGMRSILAANNEYTNVDIIHGDRASLKPENAEDVRKSKAAMGVSVMEIAEENGKWHVVIDSPYNRRITPDTPMDLTGPARGNDMVKTDADPTGTTSLGTWNNCANGRTPWGTYLTCEENFDDMFSSNDPSFRPTPEMERYGVGREEDGYGWAPYDARFDISKNPNEPNRAGYVVEIDPLDPSSTPKKRTALGRFKHENAELVINGDGRAVVYMGDDERGEFLYRFVTENPYVTGGSNTDLLDNGQLYVAKFNDDGTGTWLALTPEATGMSSDAEIAILTRQAGSAVGATTMDRPEWISANPNKAEVYCTLTNNKNRGVKPNAGGDETPVGGPNPRARNQYGQIVRWAPDGGDHTADSFTWDLFVLCGNPTVHNDAYGGSSNITADNMFNSPDGIAFDSVGLLWIQTDGNYSNEGDFAGMGNNQMLVANPETGEIRRFMVGPRECEITGIAWSADRRTMFVGIQHPGEWGNSHFPDGGSSVPRSTIISVRRNDDGKMG
ncbi:MAG: PhoX family phosphatase [Pseudomonadota bacterium]